MKVLYIGYYREASEWGKVTCDKILALDGAGVDVACRSVLLGSFNKDVDPKILKLEKKDTADCDICIQHVFPHDMIGSDNFRKNIAIFETDALSIKNSAWLEHLNKADDIWVPNDDLRSMLQSLHQPCRVVNHSCDYDKYTQKYQDISLEEAAGRFKFYTITELSDIKNLDTLVKCFHSEFDRSEPVALIMKVSKFGASDDQLKHELDQRLAKVKSSLRLYPSIEDYLREIAITENLSSDNLNSLHQYGDCFVNTSHGEAWSSTTLDAVGFGSSPICGNVGGPKEYIDGVDCGVLVNGTESICECSDAAFPDTFTGRDYWFEPSHKEIKAAMRFQYNKFKHNPIETSRAWKLAGLQAVSRFTKEIMGRRMKDTLRYYEQSNT